MQLALFFTRGVSLKLWLDKGLLDREKQLYEEHLRRGYLKKVYWLTYGKDDAKIATKLKQAGQLHQAIEVLPATHLSSNKWGCLIYSFLMPLSHRRWLKSADVFKTNQIDGSWSAVLAKWLYRKPLVIRSGYTWSLLIKKHNATKYKQTLIGFIERFAYKNATIAAVTSQEQADYISLRYSLPEEKLRIIPNYINTNLFKPTKSDNKYKDRIIFVGRLNREKNLFNLIEAITQTNLTLDIYGNGDIRTKLEYQAKMLNAKVNFMGTVPNDQLPDILNRYQYFILPSLYEAMPKSLLEALACGLVCIGTNSGGISEIIEDGVNGYLVQGSQPKAIVKAIERAARLPSDSVTGQGIQRVQNDFSLENILKREKDIIASMKK